MIYQTASGEEFILPEGVRIIVTKRHEEVDKVPTIPEDADPPELWGDA